MSNILTRTGPDFSKIKAALHSARFFSFYIEDALMRARVHVALDNKDIAFQSLLDTPAVKLCQYAMDVPVAINQLDRYVATLNKMNQQLQPALIEEVITSDMPLKTLLVFEEQLIQKYITESFAHSDLRGIPMKLFPELMTKSEDSRSLDWVTLRLLNVFPEDLNDDERLYIRAALDPIRCAKGREAIKASLSEIIDYYEFAEARARIPSSKLTPWKMLALAVPACFVAGVLSHPRLAGPTYAFSGLATYGLGLAMLYIKDKQWKPRLAYTDRVRADVLLKNKFEQLYSKAPSWEQIFNPKTVVEKWLLRSYFAVMHADARDPRFYPDNWIYEQGLITYTHWASFRFLEFICHHYDGGHFAAKGARHNPYLGYLRYVGSGEL